MNDLIAVPIPAEFAARGLKLWLHKAGDKIQISERCKDCGALKQRGGVARLDIHGRLDCGHKPVRI